MLLGLRHDHDGRNCARTHLVFVTAGRGRRRPVLLSWRRAKRLERQDVGHALFHLGVEEVVQGVFEEEVLEIRGAARLELPAVRGSRDLTSRISTVLH